MKDFILNLIKKGKLESEELLSNTNLKNRQTAFLEAMAACPPAEMSIIGTSPDFVQNLEFFLSRLKSGLCLDQIKTRFQSGLGLDKIQIFFL